jgi:putative transcriptional regulator
MTLTELKNRIRKLRFEHGEMTQEELARRAGVTRQTIIALEAGKYAPSLLLAFRIAEVFGVKVEDVFQYNGRQSTAAVEPPGGEAGAPGAVGLSEAQGKAGE